MKIKYKYDRSRCVYSNGSKFFSLSSRFFKLTKIMIDKMRCFFFSFFFFAQKLVHLFAYFLLRRSLFSSSSFLTSSDHWFLGQITHHFAKEGRKIHKSWLSPNNNKVYKTIQSLMQIIKLKFAFFYAQKCDLFLILI